MKPLETALDVFKNTMIINVPFTNFIRVEGNRLEVNIQDGVISEKGVNGIQVSDLLTFVNEVFKALNADFPCRENALTITKIEEAIHWQDARTKDRLKRQVEGTNNK